MITIDQNEVTLVRRLLRLFDAAFGDFTHRHGCECPFCKALESAGECAATTFDSLGKKVGIEKEDA